MRSAASAKAAPSVGPAQGAQAKARTAPAAAWPKRPRLGSLSLMRCEAAPSPPRPASSLSAAGRQQQDEPDRDHDRRGRDAHARDCADLDAEGGERPADHGEGQREPEGERERTPRIVGARGRHHDRRERQNAGAEDRQEARGERQRQRQDQAQIAAFRTSTTAPFVMPHDMRETSLPPL